MKRLTIVALSALMSVNAFALIVESEPNNTLLTADAISLSSLPGSDVGLLSLDPNSNNDSDFFSINLNAGDWLTVVALPILPTGTDTVMALFDGSNSTALAHNDNGALNNGSAIQWQAPTTGTYYIAITGWHGATNQNLLSYYEGATHSQSGSYILTVSVVPVPEPASMLALGVGLAGLVGLRRRNRK